MEEVKEKKSLLGKVGFFQKLKSIKHIEIIIAVILGAIVLLIYFSTFSTKSTDGTAYESTSSSEYAAMLETKLAKVISQISGAGNVSVMVTLSSGPEYVYATDVEEETNTNTSGNSTTVSIVTTSQPIVVSNDMIVIKEIMPSVGGVIVVSSGAGNTSVKLEILKAIQALLDVPQTNIEVLVGK